MQTVDDAGMPATADDSALFAESEDRFAAADRLRAEVMPNLERELAVGIAHAIVGAWNTATLDRYLRAGAR